MLLPSATHTIVMFIITTLLFTACLLPTTTASGALSGEQYQFLFTKYMDQYKKQYQIHDFFDKFSTFKSNLDLIVAHNAKNLPWKMAVNEFADLSAEQFTSKMLGLNVNLGQEYAMSLLQAPVLGPRRHGSRQIPGEKAEYPTINWIEKGVVNEVKNQMSCGSCYAFASITPIESRAAIRDGKLLDLSEQHLVDCSDTTGNDGCEGGLMSNSYEFLRKAGGACLSQDYPYTAKDEGKCQKCTPVVQVTGYHSIARGDDAHIEALQSGPIAVAVAANSAAFQFYSSGVLTECTDREISHAVVLVAYEKDPQTGQETYILRNSWGKTWGNGGNMRIAVGKELCGLGTSPFDTYPLL